MTHADDQAGARVAYFSLEIALESELPTYSGGLLLFAGKAHLVTKGESSRSARCSPPPLG